jgi:hypothetical protein
MHCNMIGRIIYLRAKKERPPRGGNQKSDLTLVQAAATAALIFFPR